MLTTVVVLPGIMGSKLEVTPVVALPHYGLRMVRHCYRAAYGPAEYQYSTLKRRAT